MKSLRRGTCLRKGSKKKLSDCVAKGIFDSSIWFISETEEGGGRVVGDGKGGFDHQKKVLWVWYRKWVLWSGGHRREGTRMIGRWRGVPSRANIFTFAPKLVGGGRGAHARPQKRPME